MPLADPEQGPSPLPLQQRVERVDQLDALLPQTQCQRCGYPACRPYAEALAAGEAGPDQCPPGGDAGAAALAAVLGVPARPVDRHYGAVGAPLIARIDEARCIGCTHCLAACPVDAILGAAQRMHSVLSAECNGCELCLPPCPVDCIELLPRPASLPEPAALASHWRARHRAHTARVTRREQERHDRRMARRTSAEDSGHPLASGQQDQTAKTTAGAAIQPSASAHGADGCQPAASTDPAVSAQVAEAPDPSLRARAGQINLDAAIARARLRRGGGTPSSTPSTPSSP